MKRTKRGGGSERGAAVASAPSHDATDAVDVETESSGATSGRAKTVRRSPAAGGPSAAAASLEPVVASPKKAASASPKKARATASTNTRAPSKAAASAPAKGSPRAKRTRTAAASPVPSPEVVAQIRDLEAQLDRLIDDRTLVSSHATHAPVTEDLELLDAVVELVEAPSERTADDAPVTERGAGAAPNDRSVGARSSDASAGRLRRAPMDDVVTDEVDVAVITRSHTISDEFEVDTGRRTTAHRERRGDDADGIRGPSTDGVDGADSIANYPRAPDTDEEVDSTGPDSFATDRLNDIDEQADIPTPRPSGPLPSFRIPRTSNPPDSRDRFSAPQESVLDTARELLSTNFYLRKWGRLAMRGRSEEVDDFGYDPIYDEKVRPMLDFLYGTYFRVETSGLSSVPSEGRCVLVANHSGTLPLDGVMIKAALRREHPAARPVRWLTEDFIYHFPYVGSIVNRLGAVRACQENAERLLAKEQLVAVFPEGVKGSGKLFADRYRLQRFGRGGFIKLCLRTSTPIVPVAVVGAEETNPMLFRIEYLSKLLGLPYVPVTPTFPLLGPAGLLPAPTKWRILFGEPLDLSSYGPEGADDEILVGKLAERVRASIQSMLDRAVGARKSVFFG